ncbi:MAG TPA: LTA synthase family protein [Chitinivibrionales bacterium]|nr:LTA synthase family protein [Chitinivibrionales bacterium]
MNHNRFISKTALQSFIGRLQTAAGSPTGVAVLVFVLFIFANALKTACFSCFLLDTGKTSDWQTLVFYFVRAILPLTFVFVLLTRPRRWFWFAGFYLVQTFYMALNLIYHFSLGDFLRLSQFIGLQSEAIDLVKYTNIPLDSRLWILAADLPFFIAMIVVYSRFSNANKRMFFKPTLVIGALIMVAALFLWNPLSRSPTLAPDNSQYSDAAMVKKYGLLAFNIMDILNYGRTKSQTLSLRAGPSVSSPGTEGPRPDFVLIQLESMGAYAIHRVYHGVHAAPFLHNLTAKSIYFPYAFSYHEAGLTTDCEFSVINSIEPLGDFPTMRLLNYRYLNSMYKRLAKYDYSIVAFHGNQGHFDNRDETLFKMGVQTFWDLTRMGLKEISWGAPDGDVFNFVEGQLGTQHEPFLYHIITMSSHEPFTLVNPYYKDNRFNAMSDKHAMAYLKSMAYVDRELEKFVTFIRKARPNCYIFIYGDHTPIGTFREFKKASYNAEGKLFEFVPMFILTPDSRVHYESRCAASFIDVAPTVLAASGVPYKLHTKGTNLLNVPLADGPLPFRGGTYLRSELYAKVKQQLQLENH